MRILNKKNALVLLLVLGMVTLSGSLAWSWGFWAHKRINHIAVFTLPKGMIGFYKNHISDLTEHAVDPDKRRYTDKEEAPRHFIDLDHYCAYPCDSFPHEWDAAIARYSEDTIKKYGTVPWQIQRTYYRLVDAFKERDSAKILHYSADLGHYVGDAFVPLHATENYNGQMSGQVGIHAFWESRIPELFGESYDFFVGKAEYVDKPIDLAWKAVLGSASEVDSVLKMEKALSMRFPEDKKYAYTERNGTAVRNYSEAYTKAYSDTLNGMVEHRMRQAIKAVGSLWMSAWVDAGQPDLDKLIDKNRTKEEKKAVNKEEDSYQKGQWIGRPEN